MKAKAPQFCGEWNVAVDLISKFGVASWLIEMNM